MRRQYRVSDVRLRAATAIDPTTDLVAIVDFSVDDVRVEGVTVHHVEGRGLGLLMPTTLSLRSGKRPYGRRLSEDVIQHIAAQVLSAPDRKPQESSS